MLRFVLFCCLGLLLSSCQTLLQPEQKIPPRLRAYSAGTFSGFMVLYHKKKKNYFTADIAVSGNKLRMDLVASMGIPVMSFLLEDKNHTVIFFQTRQFYQAGKLQNGVKPFFKIPFPVGILRDVLFERPPNDAAWQCKKNKEGRWRHCSSSGMELEWIHGEKGRVLSIWTGDFRLSFHYSGFRHTVHPDMFLLKIPKGFMPLKEL